MAKSEPRWASAYGDTPKDMERIDAKAMGGKRQPGSGNRWFAKMDNESTEFLTDCKRTKSKQYTLKSSDFIDVLSEAGKLGVDGRMVVLFDEVTNPFTGSPLCVTIILDEQFKELLKIANDG